MPALNSLKSQIVYELLVSCLGKPRWQFRYPESVKHVAYQKFLCHYLDVDMRLEF